MRLVTASDAPAIQALLARDPVAWELLEGAPLRPDEAHYLLEDRPPTVSLDQKHTLLERDTAIIDMIANYPDAETWFLGLLFVAPEARGQGLGTRLLAEIFQYVHARGGLRLRLGVVVENPAARRLYERLGFVFVDRRQRTSWSGHSCELDVLERALA